jgi:hypothetical protein
MTRRSFSIGATVLVGILALGAAGWLTRPWDREPSAVSGRSSGLAPVAGATHPGARATSSSIVGTVSAWPNVRVDQALYAPEETAIAIDPTDPNRIVAVAQGLGCYYYRSIDGGATWIEGSITDPFDLGDPSLTMDANGIAYYGYIGTWQHSGIFVTRSTDAGATWRPGVPIIEHNGAAPFEDKEYPGCDRTNGPYAGSLYVAWTQFDAYNSANPADSTRILFSYSRDQGATFVPPIKVSDRGGNCLDGGDTVEGAVPATGPDGTVYLAWAGPRGLEFDRSTDGGITWGADRVISDIPGGWDFAVSGILRVNGLPVTKTDLSIGPYSGRVFVLWSDQRNGDTDVFLIHSDDRGGHWSPRVRVNGDPVGNGRDQFFPWIDVDPMTGHVYVVFYDRRATTGTNTEVWLATSTDGGDTFAEEPISQSPFEPNASIFFGDYIGIAAQNGRVRPFWMRLDGTQLSVWTALIEHGPADTAQIIERRHLVVVPNPARTVAHFYPGGTGLSPGGEVQILDVSGRLVRSVPTVLMPETGPFASWDLQDESGHRVPAGVYVVRSPAGASARFVVTR